MSQNQNENIITLTGVSKNYAVGNEKVNVLNDINLKIDKGDFIVILGKSGCGKTTLLNILGFMDEISDGTYIFENNNVSDYTKTKKSKIRNEKIGFVFQSYNLINTMTAIENVEVPMGYRGVKKTERLDRAFLLLEQMGLSHRAQYLPVNMSGGEQQRTAIARAMANNPPVILADEPTGNLDEKSAEDIMGILKDLNQQGTTVVMVTHNSGMLKYANRHIT